MLNKLSNNLTHNFLENDCILYRVCTLSDYSLNIVNEYIKVEATKLPDILRPLFTLYLSLRRLYLEKIESCPQIANTGVCQETEYSHVDIPFLIE